MLIKQESYERGIVLSSSLNIISKVFTFLQIILIAYLFGSQTSTDVLFYAQSIIISLAGIILALNHGILIPEAIHLKEKKGIEESKSFLTHFFYLYLFLGLLVTLILLINPVQLFSTISKFDVKILESNKFNLILSVPILLLFLLVTFLTDICTAFKYFTIPQLIAIFNSLFVLIFIILLNRFLSIYSVFAGIILSYLLSIFSLIYILKRKLKWNFTLKKTTISKTVYSNVLFSLAGTGVNFINLYIPLYLFSGLSVGVITYFNYGQRLANIPADLIIMQFITVIGIKFNELFAQKKYEDLNQSFLNSAKFLIFILLPISGLIFIYSEELVSIIFNRGAFTLDSVKGTSHFLKFLGLLPALIAINLLTSKLLMAGQKIRISFIYQVVLCLFFSVLYYFGIKYFKESGYLAAILIGYIVSTLLSYFLLNFSFFFIRFDKLLLYTLKFVIINVIIVFLLILLKKNIEIYFIFNMIISTVIYFTLIIIINRLFKLNTRIDDLLLNHIKLITSRLVKNK